MYLALTGLAPPADAGEPPEGKPGIEDPARDAELLSLLDQHPAIVDEILVTATKRETSTQDIPVAIAVTGGETLRDSRIDELGTLSERVPNFTAGFGLITRPITVRGLGSGQERSFEQAVAVFSDGLYQPRSRQAAIPFLDVERVEVMRGPQAVIHGLNATAGAISIVTRRNEPGTPLSVEVSTGYEFEHGGSTLTAAMGGSPHHSLGLRAALRLAGGDGFFDNTTSGRREGGRDELSGRLSAVWTPSSTLYAQARYERGSFEVDGHAGEAFGLAAAVLDPADGRLNWRRTSDGSAIDSFGPGDTPGIFGEDPGLVYDTSTLAFHLDATLGASTLSLSGGRSELDHALTTDVDATALPILDATVGETYEQTAFEGRFASVAQSSFSWMLGAYGHEARLTSDQPNVFGPATLAPGTALSFASFYELDSELWSLFAYGTKRLSDRLRLLGGVRFSSEGKRVRRDSECRLLLLPGTFAPAPPALAEALCPSPELDGLVRDRGSDNLMPEVALEWDVAPDVLLYAKAGRSAKAGGFAAATATRLAELEYDDEIATGYELGLKSRLGHGVAELNVTLFETRFDDLQVNAVLLEERDGLPVIRPVVRNAASAASRGIEIEGRWAIGRSLLLAGSGAWLDARYRSFREAPCNTLAADPSGVCDLSGHRLPFAARWSADLSLDLDHPIRHGHHLLAGLYLSASNDYFTEGTLDPHAVQDAWVKITARLGFATPDRRWTVALIGRNLAGEAVLESSQGFGGTHFLGYLGPPRTIHLQTSYRFSGLGR